MKNGGPAFPTGDHPESRLYAEPGMTLRDYFAARVMASLIPLLRPPECIGPDEPNDNDRVASAAYAMADAMLKAREAK